MRTGPCRSARVRPIQALSGTASDETNVSVPLAFTQCCPGDDFTGMPSEVVHVYWSRRHSKIEHFIEVFVEGFGLVIHGGTNFSPIPLCRWSQPVDATPILNRRDRDYVLMSEKCRQGLTAAEKPELWHRWQPGILKAIRRAFGKCYAGVASTG